MRIQRRRVTIKHVSFLSGVFIVSSFISLSAASLIDTKRDGLFSGKLVAALQRTSQSGNSRSSEALLRAKKETEAAVSKAEEQKQTSKEPTPKQSMNATPSSAVPSQPPASADSVTMPDTVQVNEQFTGPQLNGLLWTAMERAKGYRNGEEQAYRTSQVTIENGQLAITATRDTDGMWVSGEVNSKWAYTYGDFEVRARVSDVGQGVWPAAWLFNSRGVWPNGGELDLLENVNGEQTVYGTIHGGGSSGHWQLQKATGSIDPTQFHTYRISKRPGVISWWVDGVKRTEWRKESLPAGAEWPFDDYAYIGLMNVAIGGSWPGPSTADTPSTITLYVDSFMVTNAS